jgi:HAD superfamily hydrolase (TIGR01509 family)
MSGPRRVTAAIFDVDGTLVDSVDAHAEAWTRTFEAFGVKAAFEDVRWQIGKGGDQLMPVFLSPAELKAFGKRLDEQRAELFRKRYLPSVQAFPEVRALFEVLRAQGLRLALGSSAKSKELEKYKAIARIADLVDAETASEDVERSKPHGDVFHEALKQLGNPDPAEVLVVGDTPWDAIAARKAGLRTVGLRCGGFSDEDLHRGGCVEIYDDPADLLENLALSSFARPIADAEHPAPL